MRFAKFAKVLDTTQGQVLAFVDENEDGLPSVCLAVCMVDGFNVKMRVGGWPNTAEGWQTAFDALANTTEEFGETFVAKVIPEILAERGRG